MSIRARRRSNTPTPEDRRNISPNFHFALIVRPLRSNPCFIIQLFLSSATAVHLESLTMKLNVSISFQGRRKIDLLDVNLSDEVAGVIAKIREQEAIDNNIHRLSSATQHCNEDEMSE